MVSAKNKTQTGVDEKVKMLTPCPASPNCVSSVDRDRKHFIEPLRFAGSVEEARSRLMEVLSSLKRTRVVTQEENYIRAEAGSAVFRFVDDAEFYFDDQQKVIHLKSASRVGYHDLGVNRRRIEKIKKRFYEKTGNVQI